MATKLIKYKTLRIIAAMLAAVTLFLSGLFACFSIKGAFFYNRYESIGKYTDTDAFRKLMNSIEYELIQSGEYKSCANEKELEKTSGYTEIAAMRADIEKQIRDACALLDKSGVEVFVDGNNRYRYRYAGEYGTFYYTYDGGFISEDEYSDYAERGNPERYTTLHIEDESVPAPSEESAVTEPYTGETGATEISTEAPDAAPDGEMGRQGEISEALRTIWELTEGLNYGEAPADTLVKKALSYRIGGTANLNDLYDEETLDSVSRISGVKFAVFYKTTGRVYTNCGVKADDTREAVLKKTGSNYAEIYENGEYSVTGATDKKVFPLYGNYELYPALLSESRFKDVVDRAYFAYDTTFAEGFPGVGLIAYNGYVKASSIHNAYSEKSLAGYGIAAVACFLLAAVCCLFCIITAGRTNSGEIKIRFFDRVPFAVNLVLSGGLVAGFAALIAGSAYFEHDLYELFVYNVFPRGLAMYLAPHINGIQALLFTLAGLIVTGLIASAVRNIKNKTFFKHTLIYCVITPVRFILRKIRGLFHALSEKTKKIYAADYAYGNGKKFLILSAAVIIAVAAVNFILLFAGGFSHSAFALVTGIILNLIITAVLILFVICFDRIASGVTEIKLGSLTCSIDTRFMPGFMRSTAEDISKIREGLQEAVNRAVKDREMKTELITNVTHDLKTPLTSIITYVDLLKSEGLDGDNAPEYLGVIDEKSQKLKKLIDDLVQASKATSGAVDVNIQRLDLCEFASQIAGEYQEELKNSGIELVLQLPQEAVPVGADPALLSRVFENLIGNIRKYALEGTRAFVSVIGSENGGTIVFKNTSRLPLDTDADRLTERFYRGDASRTGEGSGLGLSISKDLCALQGGSFTLVVDGDLFKAIVTLAEAPENPAQETPAQ